MSWTNMIIDITTMLKRIITSTRIAQQVSGTVNHTRKPYEHNTRTHKRIADVT